MYQIIRVEGFTMSDVGGIEKHDERTAGVSHTNEDIDWARVRLNYDLHNREKGADGFPVKIDYRAGVENRIKALNLPKALRSDAKVMAQMFISASPEFFNTNDKGEPHDWKKDGLTETQAKYFEDALKFIYKTYGKHNVISAKVHMDEATPHLHINFVPIVEQKIWEKSDVQKKNKAGQLIFDKKGKPVYELKQSTDKDGNLRTRQTVCYSDLFSEKAQVRRGRQGGQLTELHDNFFAHNKSEGYNLERGEVQSVMGKKNHLDTLNFKRQEREKEVAAKTKERDDLTAENEKLKTERVEIEGLIAGAKQIQKFIDTLEPEKNIFGKETGGSKSPLPPDELLKIAAGASKVADVQRKLNEIKKREAAVEKLEAREKAVNELETTIKNTAQKYSTDLENGRTAIVERDKLKKQLAESKTEIATLKNDHAAELETLRAEKDKEIKILNRSVENKQKIIDRYEIMRIEPEDPMQKQKTR